MPEIAARAGRKRGRPLTSYIAVWRAAVAERERGKGMLGKAISMTAHLLGAATVLSCAMMATVSSGSSRQDPPSTLGGDDRAAPVAFPAIALAAK
jgi:hypothetical protein